MNSDTTLGEAWDYLRNNIDKGVKCPCCTQRVAENPCTITYTMAQGLLKLYKKPRVAIHIKELGISTSGGAFAQLSKWGLIASEKNYDKTKRTSGEWYITDKGERFVRGEIRVPKKIYIFNNKVRRESNELIDFRQAMRNQFDYSEVIGDMLVSNQAILSI